MMEKDPVCEEDDLLADVTSYKSDDLLVFSDCLLVEQDVELLKLVEKSLDMRKNKKYLESLAFSLSEAVTKSRKLEEKKRMCNAKELEEVLEHLMMSSQGKAERKKKKKKNRTKWALFLMSLLCRN
jgi:hypothetical protein